MFIKKLFYASAAVLMLAIAYHLGATSATAQATGSTIVGVASDGSGLGRYMAVTAAGDVYVTNDGGLSLWQTRQSVFASVPTAQSSWGALKVKVR